MSGKTELQRALTRLNDAITQACSPRPPGTTARWTGTCARAAAIGRDIDVWDAMDADPAVAGEVADTLRQAAAAIDGMDCGSGRSVRDALTLVERALRDLERLLG